MFLGCSKEPSHRGGIRDVELSSNSHEQTQIETKLSLLFFGLCPLGNSSCFLSSADFFSKSTFSGIAPECQTDWVQIRPDILSCLIWVQTVCKSYQQTTLGDRVIFMCRLEDPVFRLFWLSTYNFCKYFGPRSGCQNVRPDLDPSCLTLRESLIFFNSQKTKSIQNYPACNN